MPPRPASRAQRLAWLAELVAYDALGWGLRRLPVEWASALGGAVFRTIGPLSGAHGTARRNLLLAFPEMDRAGRDAVLAAQWENLGRYLFEFPLTDRLTPASGRIEVVGRERLEAIAASGEPAVLISGHLSNFEVMAAVIVDAGVRCRVTYRALNNPHVDRRIVETRARYGVELFGPKGGEGGREVLETLRAGGSVAFLNDQKFNTGVEAPFFGSPARTAFGPTRLALRFGGELHPMSVTRLPGVRFRVTAHPPIVLARTGDRERDLAAGVAQVNAFMEARVREHPDEWWWVHKRWPAEVYAALEPRAAEAR